MIITDNVAVKEEQPVTSTETIMINKDSPADLEQDTEMNTRILVIENEKIRREGNTLKVKTKLSLKGNASQIVNEVSYFFNLSAALGVTALVKICRITMK